MQNFKRLTAVICLLSITGCAGLTSTGSCFLCSTEVVTDYENGGLIFTHKLTGSVSEVYAVAEQYCSERQLGRPSFGPPVDGSETVQYNFLCNSPPQQQQQTYQPTPQPKSESKTDMTSAMSKCSDLGFKKGTEKFGDCVLKLSK